MAPGIVQSMLIVHVALGFAGFSLGAIALLLPKFGRSKRWHRRFGRAYALCMLGMAGLSVPLSLQAKNYLLLAIGLLTLGWVAGGWVAVRQGLRARQSDPLTFARMLRMHIILVSSSYIGAWTAFLVNVRPLGTTPLLFWVYALGPTVVGTVFIARTSARFAKAA